MNDRFSAALALLSLAWVMTRRPRRRLKLSFIKLTTALRW
jgi:hypothetical protein